MWLIGWDDDFVRQFLVVLEVKRKKHRKKKKIFSKMDYG
jgi:hypothetical protein